MAHPFSLGAPRCQNKLFLCPAIPEHSDLKKFFPSAVLPVDETGFLHTYFYPESVLFATGFAGVMESANNRADGSRVCIA